jgi:hypothetical protein
MAARVPTSVVAQKSAFIDAMLDGLDTLPLDGVLEHANACLLAELTAQRTRLSDHYDELTAAEIFALGASCRAGVAQVRDALLDWLRQHSEHLDGEL